MRRFSFILVLLLVCCAGAFALDGVVTFMWYENDPNVEYYRYQLDGEDDDKWTVLDWSASEVALEMDVSVPHVLYLQQSYDGVNWSASSCADSEVYEDTSDDAEDSHFEESVEFDMWETNDEAVADDQSLVAEPTEVDDVIFTFDAIEIERYDSMDLLDYGFGYLNYVPNPKGPKNIGISGAYTHSFMAVNPGELCVKANASLYMSRNLALSSNINVLALFSAKIGNCDVFAGIGPEVSFGIVKNTYVSMGMAVEAGVRYNRSKTLSVGFALSDHYGLMPASRMDNRFDVRVFMTKVL